MTEMNKRKMILGGILIVMAIWLTATFGVVNCSFEADESDVSSVFLFRITEAQKQEISSIAESFNDGNSSYEELRASITKISDENGFSILSDREGASSSTSLCKQGDSCFVSFGKGYLFLKFSKVGFYTEIVITDADRID